MYVTVWKAAGLGSPPFIPPAYVGICLIEAVASALKIAKLATAHYAAVYVFQEGRDYGVGDEAHGAQIMIAKPVKDHIDPVKDRIDVAFRGDTVPIELYKRGFLEIDALYETQNPA